MLWEKFLTTLFWSGVTVAAALCADYAITILLLDNPTAYTPLTTFAIAAIVTVPVSYALVSGRYDLKRARDELAAARDAAVEANTAKTVFFSNMSHELRTPLNAILGFSEMLALESFAGKRVEYAKLIHASGSHLLNLVNDILDLSRIEAGRFELKDETVDMGRLVDEALTTLEPRASAAGVKLVRKVEPCSLNADARAIKQIFLNLLTNAIKFSPRGGTVEAFVKHVDGGEVALGVRDEGRGIDPKDHARVFERYGQARHDLNTAEKGTGLGLPIVKGLAEAHGGRVTLESRLGAGTRVSVLLPAERVRRPMTEASSA